MVARGDPGWIGISATALALGAVLALPSSAAGAFPGANGRIAFEATGQKFGQFIADVRPGQRPRRLTVSRPPVGAAIQTRPGTTSAHVFARRELDRRHPRGQLQRLPVAETDPHHASERKRRPCAVQPSPRGPLRPGAIVLAGRTATPLLDLVPQRQAGDGDHQRLDGPGHLPWWTLGRLGSGRPGRSVGVTAGRPHRGRHLRWSARSASRRVQAADPSAASPPPRFRRPQPRLASERRPDRVPA